MLSARFFLMVFCASMLSSNPASADSSTVVEGKLPSGKIASAEYHAGKPDKPAVLILHGFLQTRTFPTVANAAQTLADANYTVLAPTLSLGISRRNQSLPCEALHTHTLQEDVAEIGFWVRWLGERGHKQIALVGHSFGSVQILEYLTSRPSPLIAKAILISLTDVEVKQNAQERSTIFQELRNRIARKDLGVAEIEFSQCKLFVGPPQALITYLSVTRSSILNTLSKPRLPVEVLLGSNDDRMGGDWISSLKARGTEVRIINGANHFFDNQHEFDLHDALAEGLGSLQKRKAGN